MTTIHDHQVTNRYITAGETFLVLLGISILFANGTVYNLFPWLVVGISGLGSVWLFISRKSAYTSSPTMLAMYAYGFVVPAFLFQPFGHDGLYMVMIAILALFGGAIWWSTSEQWGGGFLGGIAGTVGVLLSTGVLYAL